MMMKTTLRNISVTVLASVVAGAVVSGCASPPRTTTVSPAPAPVVTYPPASPTTVVVTPATPAQRVTYPEGAYELYGGGTAASPYYWVWVPRGTQARLLPPPPPLPVR
jgi:hypothetical protein